MQTGTPSPAHPLTPSGPRPAANLVALLGLVSSLLLALAFPPIGFAPAVWLAPIGLVLLIRQQELVGPTSWRGRHPYLVLWCTSLVFWLYAVHWLRLPHWAGYFSWMGLSILMACYTPLFVGLSRVLVHRCRLSVILAAPIVWTGLELLRAYFPDGFTMASLSQAPYRWLTVLQVADLAGGYGLSFVIVFAAACVARMMPWRGQRAVLWPVVPLLVVPGATLAYGHWRLSALTAAVGRSRDTVKVALIQGSFDTTFERDPSRPAMMLNRMYELSRQAIPEAPDLLIWPETVLGPLGQESTGAREQFVPETQAVLNSFTYHLNIGAAKPASLLVGAEVVCKRGDNEEDCDDYNSALLLAPSGRVLGRYDKTHAVIFGEYMPLGDYFPWLYALSPLRDGLREGQRPESFELGGVRFCPSICYESILPHEVRRAVARLRAEGREPDVLVNQTNSGWFWGSSELDLHLACNVLRAVECRKPMLVAANTGISAWIDDTGAIREQGPRRAEGILYATVGPSRASSVYTYVGDWPAGMCLIACGLAALVGLQGRWSARRGAGPRQPSASRQV